MRHGRIYHTSKSEGSFVGFPNTDDDHINKPAGGIATTSLETTNVEA
jgi:hypothetical protein